MAKYSVSTANNLIEKALYELVDPALAPKEIDFIWSHFHERCVFCDNPLDRSRQEGRMDHLVSKRPNCISNRVLACGECNDEEKSESDWVVFLSKKCADDEVFDL